MRDAQEHLRRLLVLSGQDDELAFSELYKRTDLYVWNTAFRILREPSTADDVSQISYIKIWCYGRLYNPKVAPPLVWISAIVRNSAIDELQRRDRVRLQTLEVAGQIKSKETDAQTRVERDEITVILEDALLRLSAENRQMVEFAYLEDFSRKDLANLFDKPVNTIKTRLRRSLDQMRVSIDRSETYAAELLQHSRN